MPQVVERKRLEHWRRIEGKTVRKEKRQGLLSLLTLIFDDLELPLGNAYLGRSFVGSTVQKVSFHCREDKCLSGTINISFDDREISSYDSALKDYLPPEEM